MAIVEQDINNQWAIYNGDTIEVTGALPNESVHLQISSPPFCGLYHYSSSERDLSNCRSYEEFFEHYEFVVRESFRVLKPGRISAIHCMDIPKDGANICGYRDFPGDIIRLHEKVGFEHTPRICIWKEPLAVRNRTMSKSLAHRTIVEDSTLANVAGADYLIPFRKKGINPAPVTHEHGILRYAGERQIPGELLKYRGYTGKQTENLYSHWIWRQYASCFWDDIRGNTGKRSEEGCLPYRESKSEDDEKHLHPLQLDVGVRAVELWTNPGETVLTQFMGIGSEVFAAVVSGRRGIGAELNPSYFRQAKKNLESAERFRTKDEDTYFRFAEETADAV